MKAKKVQLTEEQKERFKQLENERNIHDAIRRIKKQQFLGSADLNIRLSQYTQQFNRKLKDHVLQVLNDFKSEDGVTLLQALSKSIDIEKPVMMYSGKIIYFDGVSFKDGSKK